MFQLVFPALKRCVVTLLWGWVTNPCVLVSDHCFFKHTLPDKLGLAGYQIDLQLDLYSCREKCLITILFLLSCGVDGSICVEWSLFLMIYEVWKAFESFHSIWYKRAFKISSCYHFELCSPSECGCISSSESSVCVAVVLQATFHIISVHLSLLMVVYLAVCLYIISDLMKRIRALGFAGERKCMTGTAEMV